MATAGNDLITLLNVTDPIKAIAHLDDIKLLEEILPELTALKATSKGHKDNYYHTLGVLENCLELGLGTNYRLAAIFHDIGKAVTKKYYHDKGWTFHQHEEVGANMLGVIWERLGLPAEYYDDVFIITKYHGMVRVLSDEGITDSAIRRFVTEVGEKWRLLMVFCKTDLTTKYPNKKYGIRKKIDELTDKIEKFLVEEKEREWRMAITGNDIMDILGIAPGRELGNIKTGLEKKVKAGEIPNDREILIGHIKSLKK